MSSNIYFLLLILLILVVIIIIINLKKPIKEDFYQDSEINQLIDTSEIQQDSIDNLMLITKLDVVKQNEHPNFPDKHLLIEGTNLEKVTDVFFGDLKGIKLSRETLPDEKMRIRILPPSFTKYTKMKPQNEFENIEIKLKIDDEVDSVPRNVMFGENESLVFNTDYVYSEPDNISSLNMGVLEIDNELDVEKRRTKKLKLKFKINSVKEVGQRIEIKPFKLRLNETEYNLDLNFINSNAGPNANQEYTLFLSTKDFTNIRYNINTSRIFTTNNTANNTKLVSLEVTELQAEYLHDDINVLLPTGLFYRFDYTTAGENLLELNPNSWNVFLSDRLENDDILIAEDVRKFYQDIKDITNPPPTEAPPPIDLKVKNVRVESIEGDNTILRMKWDTPDAVNNFRFAFLINILPVAEKDRFSIKDEQISFEKETFDFPTNKLTPGNSYKIQVSTYRTDKREVVENSEETNFRYVPPNFDDYHSHLFDPVTKRFRTELTQDQPELIKTYYQLLAANKIKMMNEMSNAGTHIEAEAQCIEGNLNQLTNNSSSDSFDSNLADLLKQNADAEKAIFTGKQKSQQEQMDRVKEKIAELEVLQGKIKKVQNTNIKRITSQKDGTDLSVKKLENGKFMVGLNQGCLAVDSMGQYKYIPCNPLDKKQHFDIDEINDRDEYNNLLLLNLNPKLPNEKRVDYPFTILKPSNSTKCVHVKEKSIQIKPCNDDESIRFTSHFYQNDTCDRD